MQYFEAEYIEIEFLDVFVNVGKQVGEANE